MSEIELVFRRAGLELNYLFEGVKAVINTGNNGKIRIHAWLSNTSSSYTRLHSWTIVSLRLFIGQFLSLHFKDRDEDFLSKGSKGILHDKIFSCTM